MILNPTATATTTYQKTNTMNFKRNRHPLHLDNTEDNPSVVDMTAIATKAYFLYADRGFTDGGDVTDWLKAEAQVSLDRTATAAIQIHA